VKRPQIAIVSHDGSINAFGRALVLADLLQDCGDTQLVAFGESVWAPARGEREVTLLPPPRTTLGFPAAVRALGRAVRSADLIVASKQRVLSFGAAALIRGGRPLILDIDDLEHPFVRRRLGVIRQAVEPDREPITRLLEHWSGRSTARTVASRALQRLYGGVWLPHIRDREGYALRASANGPAERLRLGLEGRFVVGFVGTARPHKGLLAAADAVAMMGDDVRLLIAGAPPSPGDLRVLDERAAGRLVVAGNVPIADLPGLLGACDAIVVPQSARSESVYQSPAKLLDAMACGAAIVASDVGDAREILGDTGLLVPPDSPGALMEALTSLRDADLRNRLGSAAEARYSAAFALGTWQAVMAEIVGSALAGTRALPGVAT